MKKFINLLVALCFLPTSLMATTIANKRFTLQEATIASVQRAIKHHQLTCQRLVKMYINRIKQYDLSLGRQASLNAIVAINPYVINDAKKLDRYYRKHKHFSGSLFCVPVIVKDNINTTEMNTTSGSLSMLGSQPVEAAFIVKKLRQAGALIIADGAMDEFASGMSGISSRSGRVGNVYAADQNSGGSSAGPGVAVSANFALVGIGTDNSGSVRIPAAFNGDVGLRPSMGLVSQTGIFPRGNLDGTAGPITRNVTDLAKVLSVIAQADPHDLRTQAVPRISSYTRFLKKDGLKGKRIGIVTQVAKINMFKNTPKAVAKHFHMVYKRLQKLGATVVNNIRLKNFDTNRQNNTAGEVQEVNRYLRSFASTRKDYRDICHSNRTRTFGSVKACLHYVKTDPKKNGKIYKAVLQRFAKNRAYVEKIMDRFHLDALILPLNSAGALTYNISQVNTWRTAVSSNAGLPAITINAGYTKKSPKMPIAMELVARQYQEGTLISMAYACESHFKTRLVPHLKINNNLDKLTIAQFNNLITTIGWKSYQQVLKKEKSQVLPVNKFQKIVSQVAQSQHIK